MSRKKFFPKTISKEKVLLVFFGFFSALVLLEAGTRLLPARFRQITYLPRREEWYFTSDRRYTYRPLTYSIWGGIGSPHMWHFNNLGFRERGVSAERKKFAEGEVFRIAFMGDSLVMGLGVEDYESMTRRLEQVLQAEEFEPGMTFFEVFNFGIWGYSTPQYYSVFTKDVLKINPDMVILGFYPFNDVGEAALFEQNKKYLWWNALPDRILTYKVNDFLLVHSQFYRILASRYYSFVERYNISWEEALERYGLEEMRRRGWDLSEELIGEMSRLAKKNSFPFVIVSLPSYEQVVSDEEPEYSERLSQIIKKYSIPYFDVVYDLRRHTRPRQLYLTGPHGVDNHYSPEGNQEVARAIAGFLKKNKLVPSRQIGEQ